MRTQLGILLLGVISVMGCAPSGLPAPTASSTPAATVNVTSALPSTTAGTTPTTAPTLNASVSVCGSLVRWASDGNTQLARIDVSGTITEYRLQVSYGTTMKDPVVGIPYPVRLTGRQVSADGGSSQAVNLVDYNLIRTSSCP